MFLMPACGEFFIPLCYQCENGAHCHFSNALKVYQKDGQTLFRVVKAYHRDDLRTYVAFSGRLEMERRNKRKYYFTGTIGDLPGKITFRLSRGGHVQVKWQRVGFMHGELHVCAKHIRKIIQALCINTVPSRESMEAEPCP